MTDASCTYQGGGGERVCNRVVVLRALIGLRVFGKVAKYVFRRRRLICHIIVQVTYLAFVK